MQTIGSNGDGIDDVCASTMSVDENLHRHAGQGRGSRQMIIGDGAHACGQRRIEISGHGHRPVHFAPELVRS